MFMVGISHRLNDMHIAHDIWFSPNGSCWVSRAKSEVPASCWSLAIGEKREYMCMYEGEMCATVTPPSADCESSIVVVGD